MEQDQGGTETGVPESNADKVESILASIKNADHVFSSWQMRSDRIDRIYSSLQSLSGSGVDGSGSLVDREFNLFWASMEVVKPSIYSRPPVPVVTPNFKDRKPVVRVASEMLERDVNSSFALTDINEVMLGVRDDLAINGRGVIWVTYESGKDSKPYKEKVCVEHLDRKDFIHEPARKWSEVSWVARRAWLTVKEARQRFKGELYLQADYGQHKDDRGEDGVDKTVDKAAFYEVWHRTDNKVYWVSEGCDEFLDSDEPHLKLQGFFPCPRPAFGTLERRTLKPVPDITYIETQLESINELTAKIHNLVLDLQVKGIFAGSGDIGDAIEFAYRTVADKMIIPVPGAAMSNRTGPLVEWLPIEQIAQTIIAAVEARRELIGNVQELLGIADIMRGETEAQETLGAQRMKAQYGSVRIRDKVAELVRIARDTVRIVAEIMAEEFSFDTLLEMSQMDLPTQAEARKQLADVQNAAKKELRDLAEKAEEMLSSPQAQQADPQAAQQQFQQMQQAILAKYGPQIEKLGQTVTQEDVKKLLRDSQIRPFVFDIATDSTIFADEQAEKESRNEFMATLAADIQGLASLVSTGPAGAKLVGGLVKFHLAPFRAGRELEGLIDEWAESLENIPQQQGSDAEDALAESQKALAEAEKIKGQAAMASVEARAAQAQADNERKMVELQQKAENDRNKLMAEAEKLRQSSEANSIKAQEAVAKVDLLRAQTMKALNEAGIVISDHQLDEFKSLSDIELRQNDQAMRADSQMQQANNQAFEQEQRLRGEDRQDFQLQQPRFESEE